MHTPTPRTHTCTHTDANTHTPGFALGFFLFPPFSSIAVAKLIFFAPNLLYLPILQQCQSLALTLRIPYITERLLMGCKESNQTKQTKHHLM